MPTNSPGLKPSRVVSLVPSYTESLFDLGVGEALVGITDYCIHPYEKLKDIKRIGGPKNPRINEILALRPDLVLANREENVREDVEFLESAGIKTMVMFPRTVQENINDLWSLVGLFHSHRGMEQIRALERSLEMVERSGEFSNKFSYFCPVWQEITDNKEISWMTISDDTYTSDLLRVFGGTNCTGKGLANRYPTITAEEVIILNPEVIFLPSEPFCFDENDRKHFMDLFKNTDAERTGRICLLDGTLITWYGTRLGKALGEIPPLINSLLS